LKGDEMIDKLEQNKIVIGKKQTLRSIT